MVNRLINPFTLYVGSFGTALLCYLARWSRYYPPLDSSLVLFLIASFALSAWAAIQFIRADRSQRQAVAFPGADRSVGITIALYTLWIAEFIQAGGVPLYMILTGAEFNYRTFGIPTLHVFLVTFSSFYSACLFHHYLRTRSRSVLVIFLINMLSALLIFNRGMLLMNMATCLFVFLSTRRHAGQFSMRGLAIGAGATLTIAFLFGALGTIRISHQIHKHYSRTLVYGVGDPTPSFRQSVVPVEFFWSYLYITSPLANLQLNIDQPEPPVTTKRLIAWSVNEVLPDAVSKRVDGYFGANRVLPARIAPHLNAATVYAGSFAYGGWLTMGLMTAVLLFVPFAVRKWLGAESRYFVVGMSLLNTLFLFLIFDNMLSFTGFSFQLAYPMLFSYLERRHILPFGP